MGRLRNMRGISPIAGLVLIAAALVPTASASAQGSTKTVTIKVVGIDRNGKQVAVRPSVTPLHGSELPTTRPTYHLKPGRYFIGADVLTATSNPDEPSQTIVDRLVNVRTSGTIKLNARGGRPVSVWLDGKDLGAPTTAAACIGRFQGDVTLDSNFVDPTHVYLKPSRAAGLNFVWGWNSGLLKGASYDLSGQTLNSLPAHPAFRLRTSQLDKTVIQVRAGTLPGTGGSLSEWSTLSAGCGVSFLQGTVTVPSSVTVYRSPAFYQTEVDTYDESQLTSLNIVTSDQRARHGYTVTLGGAVRGPGNAVPFVHDGQLSLDPQWQFVDSVFESVAYDFTAAVKLTSGGHVVAKKQYASRPVQNFTAHAHAGRWYTLTTDARQAGPLSTRTTLAWRFKLAKGASGGVPVADTSFVPLGLDLHNRAAPGSKTSVRVSFTQGSYAFAPKPAAPVRFFAVEASFNDGKTWHGLGVVKHKGFWTFVVRNPSSGFVTLRTVTVNTHGNSSTETIYRAYGIR